jgi:protein TonB
MLLLLLLAQAADQMPAQRARPTILFSNQGYPMTAWRNGWEGDVVADLTVSSEGQVTACRIVQSSGHEVLDHSTCYIITKYSRFTPARDKSGNAVEDHFRTPPIVWRLPH